MYERTCVYSSGWVTAMAISRESLLELRSRFIELTSTDTSFM